MINREPPPHFGRRCQAAASVPTRRLPHRCANTYQAESINILGAQTTTTARQPQGSVVLTEATIRLLRQPYPWPQ